MNDAPRSTANLVRDLRFELRERVEDHLRARVSHRPLEAVLLTAAAGFALGYVLPARVDLFVARKLVWLGLDQIFAPR